MKKYEVCKRTTEITSYKAARTVYEGMTLDEKLNHGNISPEETHEFNSEKEAYAFLNQQSNNYWYNGSGCGEAVEWWLEEYTLDKDGDETGACACDICPNSNLAEFLASMND